MLFFVVILKARSMNVTNLEKLHSQFHASKSTHIFHSPSHFLLSRFPNFFVPSLFRFFPPFLSLEPIRFLNVKYVFSILWLDSQIHPSVTFFMTEVCYAACIHKISFSDIRFFVVVVGAFEWIVRIFDAFRNVSNSE